MKSHTRVVIIGGGVVGCSILYHLTKLGWSDVTLIERSELTSGSKGMIFVLMIIFVVLAAVIGGIGGALGFFSLTASLIVAMVVNTITGAIQGAGIASIYVDLRTAKEGTDTSTLADVFS